MLCAVARDVRGWLDAGIAFQHAGVNATTADVQKSDLERRIVDAFALAGVPLSHVILEINEAVFMSGADRRVALVDFGAGFASLTHLMDFPVDIIKIDKSFVDRIGADGPGRAIVALLIEIAAKMGVRIERHPQS